mgnify:CR=1 FL=1
MVGVIEQMLKPSAVGVDEINPNRAKITLEPLERGFGHTLGNALRRVLLSSVPGAAVVEVEIEGVKTLRLQVDCSSSRWLVGSSDWANARVTR